MPSGTFCSPSRSHFSTYWSDFQDAELHPSLPGGSRCPAVGDGGGGAGRPPPCTAPFSSKHGQRPLVEGNHLRWGLCCAYMNLHLQTVWLNREDTLFRFLNQQNYARSSHNSRNFCKLLSKDRFPADCNQAHSCYSFTGKEYRRNFHDTLKSKQI